MGGGWIFEGNLNLRELKAEQREAFIWGHQKQRMGLIGILLLPPDLGRILLVWVISTLGFDQVPFVSHSLPFLLIYYYLELYLQL